MSKKARGPNFTSNEKEILIHFITKYKDVVENKKTDAVTTAIKNEGWQKLTEEFNSMSSFCSRNTEQLKTCWDNIKRVTRKEKAATKKQTLLTGGGRPALPPTGSLQGQVETLLGPTLDGMQNEFDSDAQFQVVIANEIEVLDPVLLTEYDTTEPTRVLSDCSLAPEKDTAEFKDVAPLSKSCLVQENKENLWNGWSPAALKTKVSDPLLVNGKDSPSSSFIQRRRPKASLHDKLIQSKIELVELMKSTTKKEAEMKQAILAEQLNQEKIKTEILKLELRKIQNE